MKLAASLIFPLMLLAGCSGAQLVNAITPRGGYSLSRDLAFGDQGLKLDVYRPDHAVQAPVVVFFYGGSWKARSSLDKSAYRFVAQALTAQGYVVVIPDYRLYPTVKYPLFLQDCAQAVAWAQRHAADYGGDPARLVLMGHSAGAYNAAMLALDAEYLGAAGADRSAVRGVVGLAGPYDFLPIVDPELQDLFGPRERWPLTQPIHYVDGQAPPMLLLAGDDDTVVLVKNTNNLYQRIRERGGRAEKFVYPSMGHIRIVALMSSRLPGHAELMGHVADFIAAVTGTAAAARTVAAP
jgi:acetyl esterase/lipase